MKETVDMTIERDKTFLIHSKEGEKKENEVVFTFYLTQEPVAEGQPGEHEDALIKVRSVTFRYYEGFATLQECQDMEYISQTIKESKTDDKQTEPEFLYAKKVLLQNQKVPGTFQITVKKIITTLENPGKVILQVNLTTGNSLSQEFVFMKENGQPKILDFYPDYGAVYAGGKGRLNWITESCSGLKLTEDTGMEVEVPSGQNSVEVTVSKTTEYTLQLLSTKEDTQTHEMVQKTKIQVLPLYLSLFQISKDRSKALIQVFCAKEIKINQEPAFPEPTITEIPVEGRTTMLLEANDGCNSLISTLYCGKGLQEQEISLFRKTIICQQGLCILRVNWQNLSLAKQSLKAVAESSLKITDHKTGITDLFYQSHTADAQEHEWEMLLVGHSMDQVNTEVTITMQIKTVGGETSSITL